MATENEETNLPEPTEGLSPPASSEEVTPPPESLSASGEGGSKEGEGNPTEEGEKPTEELSGDQEAPAEYSDFTMPEGLSMDEELLTAALPMFKDLKLTQEQAQGLVDLQTQSVQKFNQSQVDSFEQMVTDWKTQSQSDKEFGGDDYEKNVATAQAAITAFGTPELKQFLDDTGSGSNPEFVRFAWKVGRHLVQDNPTDVGGAPQGDQDRVSLLYPNN